MKHCVLFCWCALLGIADFLVSDFMIKEEELWITLCAMQD